MQRSQTFQYDKPPVASLDFSDHLRLQYQQCETALAMFQAESHSGGGVSVYDSKIAWDKFDGCVSILVHTILGVPDLKTDTAFEKAVNTKTLKKFDSEGFPCTHGPEQGIQREAYGSRDCGCTTRSVDADTLDVWTAITDLFHRKQIFRPPMAVFGGHM